MGTFLTTTLVANSSHSHTSLPVDMLRIDQLGVDQLGVDNLGHVSSSAAQFALSAFSHTEDILVADLEGDKPNAVEGWWRPPPPTPWPSPPPASNLLFANTLRPNRSKPLEVPPLAHLGGAWRALQTLQPLTTRLPLQLSTAGTFAPSRRRLQGEQTA